METIEKGIMTTEQVLNNTGLNWNVRKEEIQTIGGIYIPNKVAIIREDNNAVLSVMSDGYEAYQNNELLDLLFKINKSTGLEICKGGDFANGAKVWFQFKSDDLRLGTDKIEGYVTGTNSFDGSTSLCFGNSSVTISCMNTFFRATRSLDNKIKHSTNMKPRVEAILVGIDQLIAEEKKTFETIKVLSETPMKNEMKDHIMSIVFGVPDVKDVENISTRKKNQFELFNLDWEKEVNQKGMNLWGGMSAVTRYTTHSINKIENKRNELKMFGRSGDIDRKVWQKVLTQLPANAMAF